MLASSPAGAAVVLRGRREELLPTPGAHEVAVPLFPVQGRSERRFRASLSTATPATRQERDMRSKISKMSSKKQQNTPYKEQEPLAGLLA